MKLRFALPSFSAISMVFAFVLAAPVSAQTVDTVRDAATRGFSRIQVAQKQSLKTQACATTCHLQGMGAFAYRSMRDHGLRVDEETAKADATRAFNTLGAPAGFSAAVETWGLGEPGILSSLLLAADTMGAPRSVTTEAFGRAVALTQQPAGDWTSFHMRAPSSYSSFTFTAYGLRALQVLSHPSQKQDVAARVARARRWLESHKPHDTEERTFQLLGLWWAGADHAALARLGRELAASQRSDGGWNSLDGRESEAYSTGQALVALHDAAGMSASDPTYRRGIAFLIGNQATDGSWHVTTRLPPFVNPPYFESGYPYGRDQFISVAGASWAVMALTRALPEGQSTAPLPLSDLQPQTVEPWVETVMWGSLGDVRKLLDAGLDPNAMTEDGGLTPLMMAMPDVNKAKLLVARGATVNTLSRQRHYSALTMAALTPEGKAAVQYLRAQGAKVGFAVEQPAPTGNVSNLFAATLTGHPEALRLLRDDAALRQQSSLSFGVTLSPLSAAAMFGRIDSARALIALGADVNDGPLGSAVISDNVQIARMLIDAGADANGAGTFPVGGTTPLHIAAYIDKGTSDVVELLLKAGARTDLRDAEGQTPLDIAEKWHNVHVLSALHGAAARQE